MVTASFRYHGKHRIVTGIKIEHDYHTLIGKQIRVCGRFSFKIRRYKIAEMTEIALFNS